METLHLVIRPQTAFGGPIRGDTLFRQLCWAVRNRFGEARLKELLVDYHDRPFAVCSDAFPRGFLPRSALPLHRYDRVGEEDRKAVKKRHWLPTTEVGRPVREWLAHCVTDSEAASRAGADRLIEEHPQPHNSIHRGLGTTHGGDFAPYTLPQHWYGPGLSLDLWIVHQPQRFGADEIHACLTDIGQLGYGRDASVGLGKFEIDSCERASLPEAVDGDACYTLAPCAPQGIGCDPERSFYQPFTRFGRHGDRAVLAGRPFSADDIAQACNRFYRPILQRELDLLRQRGLVDQDWAERMESLLQQLQPAFEGGKAFLLRVGRHSGAESVTLDGVRSIKIMKGKGKKPDWSDSPKTVWLAGHERQAQHGLLPFGWLLVELAPEEEASLFDGSGEQDNLASWQRKVQARIDERREAAEREQAEREAQRRREQEAAARQAAELAEQRAREEAERRAREAALQQMDPVQREVEEFDRVLDAIHALESNHWGDKQGEAARYLRERMQREGVWVEQSKKKKPEKDKPYQRTLLVLKYLA